MSSTMLVRPVGRKSLYLVEKPVRPKTPILAKVLAKKETDPLIVVFVASVIAFHLAVVMVGSIAAWAYYVNH